MLHHGKIIYKFHDIKLSVADCHRVSNHFSKAHDILCVIRDNCKQVVGLIYINTKQLVSLACSKGITCKKLYHVNRPLFL